MYDEASLRVDNLLAIAVISPVDLAGELHPATRVTMKIIAFDELDAPALETRRLHLAASGFSDEKVLANPKREAALMTSTLRAPPLFGRCGARVGRLAAFLADSVKLRFGHVLFHCRPADGR